MSLNNHLSCVYCAKITAVKILNHCHDAYSVNNGKLKPIYPLFQSVFVVSVSNWEFIKKDKSVMIWRFGCRVTNIAGVRVAVQRPRVQLHYAHTDFSFPHKLARTLLTFNPALCVCVCVPNTVLWGYLIARVCFPRSLLLNIVSRTICENDFVPIISPSALSAGQQRLLPLP